MTAATDRPGLNAHKLTAVANPAARLPGDSCAILQQARGPAQLVSPRVPSRGDERTGHCSQESKAEKFMTTIPVACSDRCIAVAVSCKAVTAVVLYTAS